MAIILSLMSSLKLQRHPGKLQWFARSEIFSNYRETKATKLRKTHAYALSCLWTS